PFTQDMLAVLLILGLTIYLFVSEVVRVDVAAILIMVLVGATGVVPAAHVFDGFASNAVISIIAVMIMGAGLDRTGVMSQLAGYILRVGGSTEKRIIPIISGTVGIISSFMQNIGAAALFLPVVSRISTRTSIPLSRLLMPMGFCAILGGTMTMVGSSPLILLNDLLLNANEALPANVTPMQTFHLFAVTPIGIVMVTAGIVYFIVLGTRLLPERHDGMADSSAISQYFEDLYGLKGDIFEAFVPVNSSLVGKTIGDAEALPDAPFVLGMRVGREIALEPPIDEMIPAGATFALMGSQDQVRRFARATGIDLARDMEEFVEVLNPSRAGVSEVVIPPASSVAGRTIRQAGMRKRYGAHVLAIYRQEEVIRHDLADTELQIGDTLVLHSFWDDLHRLTQDRSFVVVTDYPYEVTRPHRVYHALAFFLLAIGLVLFTDLRLSLALLTGAVGMILSGVITIDEAYRSVGWQSVFLLAGLLPLGLAVETTGTAAWVAHEVLRLLGDVPLWVLQSVLAVLTTGFTLLMSNVGATVLLVPLAINIAIGAGGNPAVFALTVALAASNSFLIPTHQVNALVMGPGGYSVADFMRAGGIMTVLFLVILIPMVNLIF
ncbi:MAG: SLC13 family permease, partial [Gammaproteobacteria bacterium]|nr:SLC13 family permease [Gammaproteobacteria bacterium]